MKEHLVKAGHVVKLKGIPFTAKVDFVVETSDENYKLFLSQAEQSSLNPTHAASPDNAATSSLSFLSMHDDNLSRT